MSRRVHTVFMCIGIIWACALALAADGAPTPKAVINVTQTQVRHDGYGLIPDQIFGNRDYWLYQIYNTRITRAAIGYSTLRCEFDGRGGPLGSGAFDCSAIYSLAKGKIVARSLVKSRSFYQLAILGGTGFYSGARGQVIVTTLRENPHTERLIFGLE